jgi:hypothetical protein
MSLEVGGDGYLHNPAIWGIGITNRRGACHRHGGRP